MAFSGRLKGAWNGFRNPPYADKSAQQVVEMNNLLKFLGIDENVCKDTLNENTYFACMKVLSEGVGKLPMKILRYDGNGGVVEAREHPLYYIVNERPNKFTTATSFWSTVEFNRNHYGNAYVWIQSGKVRADTRLWILPSMDVTVCVDNKKILADQVDIYYVYRCGGQEYVFSSEEVIHLKTSNTLDDILGVSVQDQLKLSIESGVKSQKMLSDMYENGLMSKAVLTYTENLSKEQEERLINGLNRFVEGKNRKFKNIIPLKAGHTLQPLNMKLTDSQFLQIRQYSALQIASAFGIKPYQIGDYTKSSYASAEAQNLSFLVDTLLFIIRQKEEEASYKILTDEDRKKGYHCKVNVASILRTDLKTQIETLATAVGNFIYTPNEARAFLDKPALPGGDRLIGNGATIPIDLVGSQYVKDALQDSKTLKGLLAMLPELIEHIPDKNTEEGGELGQDG